MCQREFSSVPGCSPLDTVALFPHLPVVTTKNTADIAEWWEISPSRGYLINITLKKIISLIKYCDLTVLEFVSLKILGRIGVATE